MRTSPASSARGAVCTGRHARRDGGAGIHLRPQPQTWLMTSAFASRAFRFRTMTQLIALTAFVTMGMVLLALYHYKHLPELGYFLLYLVIMSVWALMVFFFPAIRSSLLQRILRSFFSLTVLASALLAAGLLG